MISFWIDYGTNFIGGTGDTQSEAAWRIPLALQLVPAIILGIGILFMPFSPRWLVNQGREDEALAVLSKARSLPPDSDVVQIEFLYVFIRFRLLGLSDSTLQGDQGSAFVRERDYGFEISAVARWLVYVQPETGYI